MKVGIQECINYRDLDMAGLWSLLKKDCIVCNMHEKQKLGMRCSDCNLIFNSSYNYIEEGIKKTRSRVGCGKRFKQFGLNENYAHVGKHQLYFFLFRPELNFRMPVFPRNDMFGTPEPFDEEGKSTWYWHIHHLNGLYFDDRKDNLLLCLNTEHNFFAKHKILLWRWNY